MEIQGGIHVVVADLRLCMNSTGDEPVGAYGLCHRAVCHVAVMYCENLHIWRSFGKAVVDVALVIYVPINTVNGLLWAVTPFVPNHRCALHLQVQF